MALWMDRVAALVIIAFAIGWCINIIRNRQKQAATSVQQAAPIPDKPKRPPSQLILTPPPTPINRTAFLQARIAYLAHMREEEIEVSDKDGAGEPIKRLRKMTKAEMIEAINVQDEDHVDALLDTWDQVQRKQREKSL